MLIHERDAVFRNHKDNEGLREDVIPNAKYEAGLCIGSFCIKKLYGTEERDMKIVGVIPARFESSRFPDKSFADICGKQMQKLNNQLYDGILVASLTEMSKFPGPDKALIRKGYFSDTAKGMEQK